MNIILNYNILAEGIFILDSSLQRTLGDISNPIKCIQYIVTMDKIQYELNELAHNLIWMNEYSIAWLSRTTKTKWLK